MSTAVKRACDACHRRKVKCDGINPCRNCSSAQLACTYNAIPQKKGPKGSRAKVISELRETQRQSSLSAKIQNRMNGAANPAVTSLAPTPGLLTNEMVKACIEFFFAHMYPTMPILSRQRVEQDAMSMDTTLDTYCLLCSLSAFMMLQPGMSVPSSDPYGPENLPGATIITATLLLEEALRVRKGYDYLQSPTLYTLATSYFLFACHYGLDLQDKAWFNIREATTMVHLVRMNKEESYQAWDKSEATRRRRLYWLLYATERAYALQHDRPLSLKATVNPPAPADDPTDPLSGQLVGFCRLVSLFRPFDGTFVDLWNKTRSDCSSSLVATLQKQQNDVIGALAGADPQLGDIARNQQWVQNLAWQINLANGKAMPTGTDMTAYQYPVVDVSREMIPLAASFSSQAGSDLLNSGLIEALLTITSDLTEVLFMMPSSGNPFTVSPRDHLHQLANILAMLRIGEHRFTPLLLVKVHEVLPRLANPMLQSAPENACEMDIFDGFGNAGMAQQSYFGVDEYKTDAASSAAGASSMQDINSPFVSSPPVLSPGMDFSHGLPTDFTPISDIVMHHPIVGNNVPSLSPGGGVPNHPQQIQPQLQSQVPTQQLSQQAQQSQQPQQSPELQQQMQTLQSQSPQQGHQLQQPQQHQHQHQISQQQQLPQQHFPQQHFSQQHTQHRQSISMLQSLGQSLSGSTSMQSRLSHAITTPPSMSIGGQPLNQSPSMASVLSSQTYVNPGLNTSSLAIRPQSQRSTSFGMAAQQIRTVGDFQALQRANSDMSSLSPLGINNIGADMDFSALR